MSSEVDICNLALSYLGDTANISSLDEGSVQAELCRRFYPMARDMLLEKHPWSFAVTREPLALLAERVGGWRYAYSAPNKMLQALAILRDGWWGGRDTSSDIPFLIESTITGGRIICTNQQHAILRYIWAVDDPVRFPPLFTIALAWLLASKLAGPIYKGSEGIRVGQSCLAVFAQSYSEAMKGDANQGLMPVLHMPPWMEARRG